MTYNASNPKSLTLSGKYFSSLLAEMAEPAMMRLGASFFPISGLALTAIGEPI